ncbi:MAG: hypothetical protein PVH80_10240 [Anaerolineae bacterium]|jgi:hypothetical protein
MRTWVLVVLAVTVAVGGCALISREPEMSPHEVVTKFYRWYIGYPGNPLVDREYRESPYLAKSFVQEVDGVLAGDFRADPILLAQDIPVRFSVNEAKISGGQATVMVSFYWGGNPTPTRRPSAPFWSSNQRETSLRPCCPRPRGGVESSLSIAYNPGHIARRMGRRISQARCILEMSLVSVSCEALSALKQVHRSG